MRTLTKCLVVIHRSNICCLKCCFFTKNPLFMGSNGLCARVRIPCPPLLAKSLIFCGKSGFSFIYRLFRGSERSHIWENIPIFGTKFPYLGIKCCFFCCFYFGEFFKKIGERFPNSPYFDQIRVHG